MTKPTPTVTTLERLMMRSLLDVFNERDEQQRLQAMREVYTPDIAFYEPASEARGQAEVSAQVQRLLDGAPGWTFRPVGEVLVNHDHGRLDWGFGPPDGPPQVLGTDIAVSGDGRIRALYVFVDPPPS